MTRDQRRLTAIVSADVVGYSRLMGRDEGGTLAALKAHLRELIDPKIAEYGGRTVKSMGDGLLLEFPSVVDAVRCAVDVQRGMAERNADVPEDPQIQFRVGINVGDIIIDGADIFGDGVNVAARLQALAEPGGICVSRGVRDQVLDKLSFAFEDLGAQEIKNIARPVEVYRIRDEPARHPQLRSPRFVPSAASLRGIARHRRWLAAVLVVSAMAVVAAFYALHQATPSQMDAKRPFRSLAVMPIDSVDPSPDDEVLALRATRELTAAAGRVLYDGLVVSSGLVQQYGKKSRDPRQIGSDLNVRYLTEGTLTRTADGHELAIELIDAESGAQLSRTTQRFAGAAPAEAVARIANALRHSIGQNIEQEIRSLPKQQRAAWEIYMRTGDLGNSPAEMRQKQQLHEEALRIDPNFVPALLELSRVLFLRTQDEPEQHEELVRRFDQVALRAAELAPKDPRAWVFRAFALRLQGNWGGAFAALDEALRIDPFRGRTQMQWGVLLIYTGKSEEALPLLARALELDPADRQPVLWRCLALSLLERDTEAVEPCEAGAAAFNYWGMNAWMAAVYANVGDADKAKVSAHKVLEANPTFTIARWRSIRSSDNPVYLRQLEHVTAGLRKAGIPEQ